MTKTTVDVTALLADVPVLTVFGGVDTHGRVHVAAAVDQLGRVLGSGSFAASAAGYRALRRWLVAFGVLVAVGVEGTGSYGAGLAWALAEGEIEVVEVDRPDRSARRREGKDDALDAIAGARAVASGRATGTPKARTAAFNQLKDLRLSAPETLCEQLSGLSLPVLARIAMRAIGRRVTELNTEITALDTDLTALVTTTAPTLTSLFGAGVDTAGQLLVTPGENPTGYAPKPPSLVCSASPPSPPPAATSLATDSTAAATATATAPSTASPWSAYVTTPAPSNSRPNAPSRARPNP